MTAAEKTPAWRRLLRGALGRCPVCGEGRLFKSYLKREESCASCGASFIGLDADDGPAWMTVGMTTFIVVPLIIFLERTELLPYWLEMATLLSTVVASVLVLLPRTKGFFVAALWLIARGRE